MRIFKNRLIPELFLYSSLIPRSNAVTQLKGFLAA
jgi:hypothetical protein